MRSDYVRFRLVALAAILLLLSTPAHAVLGLHTDYGECDQMADDAQKALCYREIAITFAAQGDSNEAQQACEKVRALVPSNPEYYDTQANLCFYDIAKILFDPVLCEKMSHQPDPLLGSSTTKEMCNKEVSASRSVLTGYTCNALFVFLPVVFLLAVRKFVH